MKVLRTITEVREHRRGRSAVGLVPTMGALHEGHVALMQEAKKDCETAYVSIFVNPTQFGPNEDFGAYPRDEGRDIEIAQSVGIDAVFVPSVEEVFRDPRVRVKVTQVSELWEGEHRPGHFDGVATVVLKLFGIFQPDAAYFGLKDLQQCAVVSAMARDLDMTVALKFVETVRESSGLAMSSRNRYFTHEQRESAAGMYQCLIDIAKLAKAHAAELDAAVSAGQACLSERGFSIEYLAFVDMETMRPVISVNQSTRLICAAKYHGVRLIDNVPVQ